MRNFLATLIITLLSAAAVPTSAQDKAGAPNGRSYVNDYFGLSLTLPDGWIFLPPSVADSLHARGESQIPNITGGERKAIEKARSQTTTLFVASEFLEDDKINSSHALAICVAQETDTAGATPSQHIAGLKHILKRSGLPIEISENDRQENIGGAEFAVMTTRLDAAGQSVKQKILATAVRGHILSCTLRHVNEDDGLALEGLVKTISFK